MKYNEETVKKLKESFAIGADVTAACAYAEISRESFYQWCKKNPKLKEEADRLRERPVLKAYQTIANDLDQTETAKWYLERKRKKDFSLRQELTGSDGDALKIEGKITIKDLKDATVDELNDELLNREE